MKIVEEIKRLFSKEGMPAYNLGDLVPIVIAFGLVAIIGAVTLLILAQFQTTPNIGLYNCVAGTVCGFNNAMSLANVIYSASGNGIGYGVSGINQVMQFLPLIGLVTVAAVIIGVVVGAFVLGGRGHEEAF